jgi:hypothetical protein
LVGAGFSLQKKLTQPKGCGYLKKPKTQKLQILYGEGKHKEAQKLAY